MTIENSIKTTRKNILKTTVTLVIGAVLFYGGITTVNAEEYAPPVVTESHCDYPDNNQVRQCYEKYDNGNQYTYFRFFNKHLNTDVCTEAYPVYGDTAIPCPTLPQRG